MDEINMKLYIRQCAGVIRYPIIYEKKSSFDDQIRICYFILSANLISLIVRKTIFALFTFRFETHLCFLQNYRIIDRSASVRNPPPSRISNNPSAWKISKTYTPRCLNMIRSSSIVSYFIPVAL